MSALKPVGVFWDIENCCVPKGKSALKIIERIRHRFFKDCREAEFICVCDINKETESTIKDLNDGQINVVHINAKAKNAADDKIRQSLRRFSDSHPPGTRVVLISSDVNFASDLSDLRHRKRYEVVLVHKNQVSDALLLCASEHHSYEDLIKDLPDRPDAVKAPSEFFLVATGYNKEDGLDRVKNLLKMFSSNCGGKVYSIGPYFAVLKFDTQELRERAKKRLMGEDVYGRKIMVSMPEESQYYGLIKRLTSNSTSFNKGRQESPSPQRREPRERTSSRSYTPDGHDPNYNGYDGSNQHYSYHQQQQHSQNSDNNLAKFGLIPAQAEWNSKAYKTPGGPVKQNGSSSTAGQSLSPAQAYTLPNSNSERYYHKSSPGDAQNQQESDSSSPLKSYVMGDLSNAANGQSITVFKSADNGKSLADIPIPSFGFRDIPPPSLPPPSSTPDNGGNNLDPKANLFDPIKLIETAALDINRAIGKSNGAQAPTPSSDDSNDKDCQHNKSHRTHSAGRSGNSSDSSHRHNFNNHQLSSSYPNFQARGQSAPNFSPMGKVPSDDEICIMHGYPPPSSGPNQPQGPSFKRPGSPPKQQNSHHMKYSPRRPSPGPHKSRDAIRCAASTFRDDRSFSPPQGNLPRQPFRQRVASFNSNPYQFGNGHARPNSPLASANQCGNRLKAKPHGSNLYRVPTPNEMGDPATDYSHPDFNPRNDSYVELIVSNLDYNIHPREWRKIIYATFHPHVKILSIQVRLQADNTSVATVRLPTEQDARFAITQFHRRKIGYKRINVQFKSDCSQSPADALRADTVALLMEAKDNKMALSRLIDLFDKRFHKTVSVSDIYKMRDTVHIQETGGAGRWVKLQPGILRTPTPVQAPDPEVCEVTEQPVCTIHCAEGSVHFTDAINSCMLPTVKILRKHFSPQLHSLLLSHNGYIPLMSFPACYEAEFQPLPMNKDDGIPLEHVISCVPGVEITVSKAGFKVIQFQENRDQFYDMMKGSSWQELGKISREVMELLRQQPSCTMPVSKFIPAYHHYFGRQCRVADYGYTKLQELFEAIPHAIQILGTGDRRAITLSPRAQLKRFTTDIIKVVKSQPAKQTMLEDFPKGYEKAMGRPLYLPHYGVAFMEDVLMDIPTTTLIVIEESKHTLLALPRRDQTPEEVERTKQFALEVVDLLRHNPQSRMPFNKFIPAYHHHFGRQCRVADYGFTKLTDLFESVGHVVEIEEEGEERLIQLTGPEQRKVVCEQLCSLLRPVGAIPINRLLTEFANHFGFCLKLDDFDVDCPRALVQKLRNNFKLDMFDNQECITLVKEVHISLLGLQVMQLLMDESGGCLPLMELCMRYESLHGKPCNVEQLREDLMDYVQIDAAESDGGVIRLTSQQMLGRNLRLLLLHHQRISMSDLSSLYRQQYAVELSPALYGFQTLYQLLLSFPHILEVRGRYIQLSDTLEIPGTIPPARIDVTSPPHHTSSAYQGATSHMTLTTEYTQPQHESSHSAPSNLLLHAAQLLDHNIAQQVSSMSINSSEPPTSTVSATEITPSEVPVAWQMKAGEAQQDQDKMNEVVRGNIGLGHKHYSLNDIQTAEHSNGASIEQDGNLKDPNKISLKPVRRGSLQLDDEKDIFSPSNRPLDTSSTNSQNTSSTHSSASASPVKRKTRIAANFSNAVQ